MPTLDKIKEQCQDEAREKEENMGESMHPKTLKLFHIAIYRPSSDRKAQGLTTSAGSGRLLFVERSGQLSSDAAAKQKIEELRKILPQGWELKITEVPFTATYGTPAITGRCSRTDCKNYNIPMSGDFFCGICGEPLSLTLEGTAE